MAKGETGSYFLQKFAVGTCSLLQLLVNPGSNFCIKATSDKKNDSGGAFVTLLCNILAAKTTERPLGQ